MPYSDKFKKILKHMNNMYNDKAIASEHAYRQAFDKNIKTFRDRVVNYKKRKLSISDMGF